MAKQFKTQAEDFLPTDTQDISDIQKIIDTQTISYIVDNSNILDSQDTKNIQDISSIPTIKDTQNTSNIPDIYKFQLKIDTQLADDIKIYKTLGGFETLNEAMQSLLKEAVELHVDKIKVFKKLFTK